MSQPKNCDNISFVRLDYTIQIPKGYCPIIFTSFLGLVGACASFKINLDKPINLFKKFLDWILLHHEVGEVRYQIH